MILVVSMNMIHFLFMIMIMSIFNCGYVHAIEIMMKFLLMILIICIIVYDY